MKIGREKGSRRWLRWEGGCREGNLNSFMRRESQDGGRQVRQDGDNTPTCVSQTGSSSSQGTLDNVWGYFWSSQLGDATASREWQGCCSTSSKVQEAPQPHSPSQKKLSAPKVPTAEVGKPAVVHEHRICPRVDFVPWVSGWGSGPTMSSSKCHIAGLHTLSPSFSRVAQFTYRKPSRCSPGGSMPGDFSLPLCSPGPMPWFCAYVF